MGELLEICSIELEAALLGDCLAKGRSVYDGAKRLGVTADTFYYVRHAMVWDAFEAVQGRIDLLTVQKALEANDQFVELGGYTFLRSLLDASPQYGNFDAHAEMIRDLQRRRQYVMLASDLARDAHSGIPPLQVYLNHDRRFRSLAMSLRTTLTASTMFAEEMTDYAQRAQMARAGQTQSLPLGLPEWIGFFDNEFSTGTLTYLMGVSGLGKTWMGLQMMLAISEVEPVMIWELEMVQKRLRQRLGAMHSGLPYTRIKKGKLSEEQEALYFQTLGMLAERPMEIITGGRPMVEIKHAIMEMQDRYGSAGFIMVDTLNNLAGRGRGDGMYDSITRVSSELLDLKTSTEVGVLGIIQQRIDFDPVTKLESLYPLLRPNTDNIQNAKTLLQHADWLCGMYSSDRWARERPGYDDPECPRGYMRLYDLKAREQEEPVQTKFHWDRSVPIYRSKFDPRYDVTLPPGNGHRKVYGQGE